jgi:hypothetical protein
VVRFALVPLALLGLAGSAGAHGGSQVPRRWPDALRSADELGDDLARARARVEVLYAAGDLPGALREGLAGLRAHPGDVFLLRRTCQLALALRVADVAESTAVELAVSLPGAGADENAARWWRDESAGLSAAAGELRGREDELAGAVRRARFVSATLVLAVMVGWIGLFRPSRRTA